MPSPVKSLENLITLNSVKHSTSLDQPRPRIIGAMHKQYRTVNNLGVIHGVMRKTIESPLPSTPEDQKLGTWK